MPISPFRKLKNQDLADRAFTLYKEGLSLRDVSKAIGRSHTWVWLQIRGRVKEVADGK
jgi:hypothetical protein